jgi:hypothetical protein
MAEHWVYSPRPRPLTRYVVALDGLHLAPAPGTILMTPEGAFVLTAERQIVLRRQGHDQAVSPESCEAHLLAKHGHPSRLLIGCLKKGRMNLALVAGSRYLPLPIEIPAAFDLDERVVSGRFLPVYSGSKTYVVDFAQTRAMALSDRDQLLAEAEDTLLVKRGNVVLRRSLLTAKESPLEQSTQPGAQLQLAESYAYVSPYLIGAAGEEPPWLLPQGVLAITPTGCALLPREPADPPRYARGPLRWSCRGNGNPNDEASAVTKARTVENRASGSMDKACSAQSSTASGNSGR